MTTSAPAKTQELSYRWAVNHAIAEEMRRDPNVLLMGEDVAALGGAFGVTRGLLQEFGPQRVIDTPISETAIVGAAIGAALTGLRPIVELQFAGFVATCFDAIFYKLGTWQQRHGGGVALPVVVRAPMGAAGGAGPEHAACPEALLAHSPGLIVVAPSTPADAKGLLKSAIRNGNPVMFLEHNALYAAKGPVPDGDYTVPIGKAIVAREGKDVTVITYSAMVPKALKAAQQMEKAGVSVEVIDLRTLVPLDEATVLASVEKTGKVVVAYEAQRRMGFGAEVVARIAEKAFYNLDAPIKRVAARNLPLPHSATLEAQLVPQVQDIVTALEETTGKRSA